LQLKVLIPTVWPAALFEIKAENLSKDNSKNCEFIALKAFKTGNEVLYGFSFYKLARLLKSFKPDLIHVEQGDNAFVYFQTILLSKLFCRNTKFTFFTWINWKAKQSLKYRLIWRFVERFNLRNSSGAFVGNQDAEKILQDKKFSKFIEVLLQLGVDEKLFKPVLKIDLKIDLKKEKYIGCIGRITSEKGVFLLVNAFLSFKDKYPDWKLLFVGDGPAKKDLIKYINKNKLKDRIEFKQSVCHEEIASVIQNLEILVLPSYDTPEWKEQFGHVLIEAMACRVPVVGSNAGNISQVIGNAGLVFKQRDNLDLALCLESLMLKKEFREELGQKGYERFKSNFSYEIIADKTMSFWQKII